MNRMLLIGILLVAGNAFSQKKEEGQSIGPGLKLGCNFANVYGSSSLSTSKTYGYHFGAFYSPGTTRSWGFGYRAEIIYSKQGYDVAKGNNTGNVRLNYILLPQLTSFNITKFVQLQIGIQLAFFVHASADSSVCAPVINPYSTTSVIDYYNKFNYGFAGGLEIYPFKGLLVGARLNISFVNANREVLPGVEYPSFCT